MKVALLWIWSHRTKTLGLLAVIVAYVQQNLTQLGHFISTEHQTAVLGLFGSVAFFIGLYNSIVHGDDNKS